MGVTIHFAGQLRDEAGLAGVEQAAREFASSRGWRVETIDFAVNSPEDYTGISIFPDPLCEPVHLVFDQNLRVDEYTKTQFAGPTVHIQLIELLRLVQPWFSDLEVSDEGEYWETSNEEQLRLHLRVVTDSLNAHLAEDPTCDVAVKLPSGRIVDLRRENAREQPAGRKTSSQARTGFLSRLFGRRG
jgi:hypothetical protein